MALRVYFLLAALLTSFPASAQMTVNDVPEPSAAAKEALSKMLKLAGADLALPALRGMGTIAAEGKTERVSVYGKPGYYRLERPDSQTVIVTKGSRGMLFTGAKRQALQGTAPSTIQAWMFPIFTDLRRWADPGTSVSSLAGSTSTNTSQGIQVTLPADRGSEAQSSNALKLSVWISNQTSLPTKIRVHRSSRETDATGLDVDLILSDYRNVGGFFVPFRCEERANRKTLYTIQLEAVSVDSSTPSSLPTQDLN
jgi:hypothetical protein